MVRVNVLSAALCPAYRLFHAWTSAREIDTDAAFQVRGVCERERRERVCIPFHVRTCMHIRAHVVGGDPGLEYDKKGVYSFNSIQQIQTETHTTAPAKPRIHAHVRGLEACVTCIRRPMTKVL
jgi:hypothetical protein